MLRRLRKRKKGQSTVEYAVLIVVIIGALMSIQAYIKRGIQGRFQSSTDDIGEQFSPGNTNYTRTIKSYSKTQETFNQGISTSKLIGSETTNITVNSQIVNVEWEYWSKS